MDGFLAVVIVMTAVLALVMVMIFIIAFASIHYGLPLYLGLVLLDIGLGCIFLGFGVFALVKGHPILAGICAGFCGLQMWHAWDEWKKGKRKKKPSKVLSRIVDLGHRLGIAPA